MHPVRLVTMAIAMITMVAVLIVRRLNPEPSARALVQRVSFVEMARVKALKNVMIIII